MNDKSTNENGQAASRFSSPPASDAASDHQDNAENPLGINVAPLGEEERSFRRLERGGADRGGAGGRSRRDYEVSRPPFRDPRDRDAGARDAGFSDYGFREGGSGNSDRPRSPGDRERDRGRSYPDQTINTDRNRERQWEQQGIERMADEGGIADFRRTPSGLRDRGDAGANFHAPQREQPREEPLRRTWWQREASTVRDVMTGNVKSVGPESSVREIAEIMRQEDVGVVPVVTAEGKLYGLVTDRDIVIRGLAAGKSFDDCRAEDLATKELEVVAPEDSLAEVIHLMGRQQIRRVPVVDARDRLIGIVSLGDIANRADADDELQEALEKISGRRSFWSRIWR